MSLPVYQNTIVNDRGDVLPEALLRVRTDPGQANVTLYKDRDAFGVLTNVGDVYADTEGFVRFYLPPGVYRMHVVAEGYERTYRHVQVAPLKEYNVVSAEQYALAITDAGNNIQFISDNPVSVEIPTDEEVEFPMWSEITLIQAGDGIITLSGDVTIQNPSGGPVKSMGKGSSIKLTLIGGNVWLARVEFDRIIDGDIDLVGALSVTGTIDVNGQFNIDSLRLDGNTISSTVSNTNINITPNGTGRVKLNKSTDVTGDATVSGDFEVAGDTVLHGNLHVKGTATIIDSTEVDIGDNIIRLNAGETGTPTLSAGFEVERGLQPNVSFLWDEFDDRWTTGGQALAVNALIVDGKTINADDAVWVASARAVTELATPANGGLLVDNQKTGGGLERVLTESDLSTSGLPNVQSAAPEDGGLLVDNQKTGAGLERVLTESDLDEPISPLRGSLFGVSEGVQNQWIFPIATSRVERGVPVTYIGSVNDQGSQMVTRTNTVDGTSETKVVYTGYDPDDHNAPAIKILPSGDILIACAGHNDAPTVHYGVFKSWDDVVTLPNSLSWSGNTTYVQLYVLDNVIMLMTRIQNTKWSARYSINNGQSWSSEAVLVEHTTQVYAWGVELIRTAQEVKAGTNDQVRLLFYPHPTKPGAKEIRRTGIRNFYGLPSIGIASTEYRSLDDLAGSVAVPFEFSELPLLWAAPAGKSCRLLDLAQAEDFLTLVCEFDETAPHDNARYLLLEGNETPTAIELPITPGEDLPHDTYFPGACFIRKGNSDRVAADTVEIIVSSNPDDISGQHTVSYIKRNGTGFDLIKLFESDKPLFRPFAVDGGNNADICISEFDHYEGYRDFRGTTRVLSGVVNQFQNDIQLQPGGVKGKAPWSVDLGGVCFQGGYHASTETSGSIDLKVPLRRIMHVSYDDYFVSGSAVTITTQGDYDSYESYTGGGGTDVPITQINWGASGAPNGFRWMVIGVPY